MASGGRRTRSGPAKDPDALRRERDEGEWIKLWDDDRVAVVPVFPLIDERVRESVVWAELWSKPQSLLWERFGLEFTVALFVRSLVEAESDGAKATDRNSARQLADALGLTPSSLLSLRWKIERREPGVAASGGGGRNAGSPAKRPSLTVVTGGAVEGADTGS